ncbi:MAG: EamA family transporter [Paracoccaceae bacterium]
MSLTVFLAVLAAALLHASWNAVVRTGASKMASMLMVSLGNGLIGLAVVVTRPLPDADIWPWLVASALIRMSYQLFLTYAYEHGDLSRVYPIARGAAPLMVLVAGAFILSDAISGVQLAGILALGAGILLMAHGVISSGESRRLVPFALGSALATAGYTLVDGIGARLSGDPIAFVGWALLLTTILFTPVALVSRGPRILLASGRSWAMGAFAALASYLGYTIVVWAMTQAPIALVAALRETSILFAVLIGWRFFGEKMDRGKAFAALLIVGGVVITRL